MQAYTMIDQAEEGSIYFRIVISPDLKTGGYETGFTPAGDHGEHNGRLKNKIGNRCSG